MSLVPARASSCNTAASRLMDWTAVSWSEHINKFWIASWFCPWDLLQATHLSQHRHVHTFLAEPAGCARNKGQWEESLCVISVMALFGWDLNFQYFSMLPKSCGHLKLWTWTLVCYWYGHQSTMPKVSTHASSLSVTSLHTPVLSLTSASWFFPKVSMMTRLDHLSPHQT